MGKILHILQVVIGRRSVWAYNREGFLAKFGIDAWVVSKFVEGPRERSCSGITASKEDGDNLITDNLGVACIGGQRMEKGERSLGLRDLLEFSGV